MNYFRFYDLSLLGYDLSTVAGACLSKGELFPVSMICLYWAVICLLVPGSISLKCELFQVYFYDLPLLSCDLSTVAGDCLS